MTLSTFSAPAVANTIQVVPGLESDGFLWPEHDIRDERTYGADFTKWLAKAGFAKWDSVTASVDITDTKLVVWPPTMNDAGTVVSLFISGGTAGLTSAIGMKLVAGAEKVEFVFGLAVIDRAPGLIALGTQLTIGGETIVIGGTPILVS